MAKLRRNQPLFPANDPLLAGKQRKPVPYEFVLDAIASLSPRTNPMFGCLAIYIRDKIVLILRDKPSHSADNGVWLATTHDHHDSLRREFPSMRSIQLLGKKVTGWQVLPADAPDFEESALHACDLVLAGDPRIGKIPKIRQSSKAAARKASPLLKPPKAAGTSAKPRGKKPRN
jgi:hypothetical protein